MKSCSLIKLALSTYTHSRAENRESSFKKINISIKRKQKKNDFYAYYPIKYRIQHLHIVDFTVENSNIFQLISGPIHGSKLSWSVQSVLYVIPRRFAGYFYNVKDL